MEQLFMMDFPADKIRLDTKYENKDLIAELKEDGKDTKTPPKIADVYGEISFPKPPEERPYLLSSIVLSADGKMAFEDISEGPAIAKQNFMDPDGALADFWILNAARTYADAVVLGARTLQMEPKNTSHIFDPELLTQRKEYLGKSGHPLNIVASFDGTDIPTDHLIFNIDPAEGLPVAIYTSPSGGEYLSEHFPRHVTLYGPYADGEAAQRSEIPQSLAKDLESATGTIPVIVTGTENRPNTEAFLSVMRRCGTEIMLIESPSFTTHLMDKSLLDEYIINYSMVYAGGGLTPGKNSPFSYETHPHAQLISLAMHKANFFYTRQRLYYGIDSKVDLSKYRY